MKILGISAFYHDSAAALIEDGNILAAAQEERFTRKKHDSAFPSNAIKYCLESNGISIDELDAIAFYDKPFIKFERLLETYYSFAPKGVLSFLSSMPVWLKEKMFIKKIIFDELKKIEKYDKNRLKLLFPEHHLSHAASTFFASKFNTAAILTIDGVGEWTTASMCIGENNKIKILKELKFPHSLGLLYSAFTYYLGFRVNSGEYKLMGLAPYGAPDSQEVCEFIKIIKTELIDLKSDGSLYLNQKYFNYATGLRMVKDKKWSKLFGLPKRIAESEITQQHANLAFAIQKVTEETVVLMAKEVKKITNAAYLCMAGGVALNCVANGKLLKENIFKDVFIQPAAGDAGGALGAALAAYHIFFKKERKISKNDIMQGSYLGPDFSNKEIDITNKKNKAICKKYNNYDDLIDEVAELIGKGNAIGWFQGRMEFGPRALGNRSIIGDARNKDMQKKMNLKIKYRESFRPFAPSVLFENISDYFDFDTESPYMLQISEVKKARRKNLPKDYNHLNLKDRLYITRSDIPAITHIDFTARLQTVHKKTNERYWKLINRFKDKTGYGIIINTSFNVRGEPIVCTPDEAYKCFMKTEMDYLVIGDYLYNKKEQNSISENLVQRTDFVID